MSGNLICQSQISEKLLDRKKLDEIEKPGAWKWADLNEAGFGARQLLDCSAKKINDVRD